MDSEAGSSLGAVTVEDSQPAAAAEPTSSGTATPASAAVSAMIVQDQVQGQGQGQGQSQAQGRVQGEDQNPNQVQSQVQAQSQDQGQTQSQSQDPGQAQTLAQGQVQGEDQNPNQVQSQVQAQSQDPGQGQGSAQDQTGRTQLPAAGALATVAPSVVGTLSPGFSVSAVQPGAAEALGSGTAPAVVAATERAGQPSATAAVHVTANEPSAADVPVVPSLTMVAPTPAPVQLPALASVPPAAAPAPVHAPVLAQQLARPLFTLVGAPLGEHVMKISVVPDSLGPVTVRAQLSAEGIHIELFSASDAGREGLRHILADLRRDLAAGGMASSVSLGSGNTAQDHGDRGNPKGCQSVG
ncbi:flagellar hook-length control protein FliK [Arthrobacter polaris]|uniref:flagellar hook-length control protein FliK n=1 Tax=Arthrobacter polaris TaxID=2813727 RepID=UPI001F42F1F8|nr:flagellar hook-length control protein FliK [Arthrobacter polaris]UIK88534.1 flagellar hook-length control protein FliK [Arthrobacter polaris]